MKKIMFVFLFAGGCIWSGQAQEIADNAIGLRFGGGNGFGAEISYQHHLEGMHRLEFDLGLRSESHYNAFKIDGLYQWVWNIEGNFNWYAGAGIGIGHFNVDHGASKTFGFIAGDIGVEYLIPTVPLQVFIDFRPEIALGSFDTYDTFGPDLGIGIRYQF